MQRILINMKSFLLGKAIRDSLTAYGDFTVTVVEKPNEIVRKCDVFVPGILLMEVTSDSPWNLTERLRTGNEVKKSHTSCKTVILVDENENKKTADEVAQAKKDGLIDQFVFNSVSATYLADVLDTI